MIYFLLSLQRHLASRLIENFRGHAKRLPNDDGPRVIKWEARDVTHRGLAHLTILEIFRRIESRDIPYTRRMDLERQFKRMLIEALTIMNPAWFPSTTVVSRGDAARSMVARGVFYVFEEGELESRPPPSTANRARALDDQEKKVLELLTFARTIGLKSLDKLLGTGFVKVEYVGQPMQRADLPHGFHGAPVQGSTPPAANTIEDRSRYVVPSSDGPQNYFEAGWRATVAPSRSPNGQPFLALDERLIISILN